MNKAIQIKTLEILIENSEELGKNELIDSLKNLKDDITNESTLNTSYRDVLTKSLKLCEEIEKLQIKKCKLEIKTLGPKHTLVIDSLKHSINISYPANTKFKKSVIEQIISMIA